MNGTHDVVFHNLVDSRTGQPVRLTAPNDLQYEGGMLAAAFLGQQAAEETLATLRKTD